MTDIPSETIHALQAAIVEGRRKAARQGNMHALWDTIFDAEAVLAGRETQLKGAPREVAEQCLNILRQ